MNKTTLIVRNLWYYRRSWLALMAGAMISTAVLTGALMVGVSVKYSLQRITLMRLGKTRQAMKLQYGFIREKLAEDLSVRLNTKVVPLLRTEGMVVNSEKNLRINRFPGSRL